MTDEAAAGATEAIARRVLQVDYDTLSPAVVLVAKQCILDWVSITLRAVDEPLVRILVDHALSEGGHTQAAVLGRGHWVSARQAALVNGAASHALDYDDVNIRMTGHPTVAVLPAALALAQARNASGKDLIAAFVAGYEAVCAVGGLVSPSHYARGFHVTGTVGTFGAAAACAKLLGLDLERTRTALGIAATQAAGLKAMFGTMCKPLHAGKACESGTLSAQLAEQGFTSRNDAIECASGFAATQSDGLTGSSDAWKQIGGQVGASLLDNLFKYHASCYQTHAPIEAIRSLRRDVGFGPDDVEKISLLHDAGADSVCNIPHPTSGLETKFSLRMLAAYAVAGIDTADIDSYTDERARDPRLTALRDKVQVDFTPGWPITRSRVQIRLKDGRLLEAEHDSGVPENDLAAQTQRLLEKLHALLDARIGVRRATHIADTLLALERLPDVRSLGDLLSLTDNQ
ncbi:MmgE/PrpD family protein [Delftia sp. Cs1-4]|uniref:MmgE/PrpD family protein n=1 Tax=Delftia sp. (strain Cs1-4) TaxID=742013 RepID=UPI00020E7D18|nr:MmgE/PrpD family protein [Delftia sp. Cs1-4]AEF88656.1 MmgE/PrpD family protein [Delftia sp. Cs1-4]